MKAYGVQKKGYAVNVLLVENRQTKFSQQQPNG